MVCSSGSLGLVSWASLDWKPELSLDPRLDDMSDSVPAASPDKISDVSFAEPGFSTNNELADVVDSIDVSMDRYAIVDVSVE